MAIIIAYYSFDMRDIDFNRLVTGRQDAGLLDNVDAGANGITFKDLYYLHWDLNGAHFRSVLAGPVITVGSNNQITGGEVTAYFEYFRNGAEYSASWVLGQTSIPAIRLFNTMLSTSTADDKQLIISTLSGTDHIWLSPYDDFAFGYAGHDRMFGFGGEDHLRGGLGNDRLLGGDGADKLQGESGNDIILGDGGDDLLWLDAGDDQIGGGSGNDTLIVAGGFDAKINLSLGFRQNTGAGIDIIANVENIHGGAGADRLTGSGWGNELLGMGGNDVLRGMRGRDELQGGRGDDRLFGDEGNDRLDGGAGADLLDGGAGSDNLYAGSDTETDLFIFGDLSDSAVGLPRDRVYQFDRGEDRIHLRGLDADASLANDQKFRFSTDGAAANSVWIVDRGADLLVRADVNGDTVADLEISVMNLRDLSAADFIL